MKMVKVSVDGYKRLRDSFTYTNGKLVAFVGPNEAGKSSLLEVLSHFSHDRPVATSRRSRVGTQVEDDHVVAEVTFRLTSDEVKVFETLDLVELPAVLTLGREAGGAEVVDFDPRPVRNPINREAASSALAGLDLELSSFDTAKAEDPEIEQLIADCRNAIAAALKAFEQKDSSVGQMAAAIRQVSDCVPSGFESESVGTELSRFIEESERSEPWQECYELLRSHVPRFLFFDEAARDLRTEYDLADEQIAANRPLALRSLLDLAGLDFSALVNVLQDKSRRESMLQGANDRLASIFNRRWRQYPLSVQLNTNGTILEVLISEHESRAVSALEERSDGLRTFVALTSFVGPDQGVPPILLIDEAETHLHYNAQADLVNMLTSQDVVAQVLYTTHSPGCLPRDLGRDVRFIEPAREAETSQIRHDFWSYESPDLGGFSPLLFVMGAGAAAFCSLRHAVIGEGPTEMLLMPSVIRAATAADELAYQIAPGVSTLLHSGFPALGSIAVRSCYLVDGDGAGSGFHDQLIEEEVAEERIFALPSGWAIEDLLDPAQYLAALVDLAGPKAKGVVTDVNVLSHHPIKSAAKAWFKAKKIDMPGPVAVAEHLLGSEKPVRVNEPAKEFLIDLDSRLRAALGIPVGVEP